MSRLEKYLPLVLAAIIPLIAVFNQSSFLEEVKIDFLLITYFQTSVIILIVWYANRWFIRLSFNGVSKAVVLIVGNLLLISFISFANEFGVSEKVGPLSSFWIIFIRLCSLVVIFNVVLRIFESQRERAKLEVQNLALQSENLKFQIDTLKQQINPHFLFNSLNTLLDLIEEDQNAAVKYTRNFSNIFRVVLQSVKYDFVPLEDELKFLNDYWDLLKVRFKDAVDIQIDIRSDKRQNQIPPLSLQFLVENAVKHNEASSKKPLVIKIWESDNLVFVKNKVSPKNYPIQSEKVGLKNLQKRFSLLFKPISYGIVGDDFVVKLPLKS